MQGDVIQWKGRLGPMDLLISGNTFSPSTVTNLVANELDIAAGETVVDVGCGCGILAIIAAKLGAKSIAALDMSPDVVDVGRQNAERNGVSDCIRFFNGDLFAPLPDGFRANVIIGDVSGIPDTLADDSGWFPSGKGGGARGSELPIRMLQDARRLLDENGRLFLPTGTLQDETAIIAAAKAMYRRVDMLTERRIPLPSAIAESQVLAELAQEGAVSVTRKGSRVFWEARVWKLADPL